MSDNTGSADATVGKPSVYKDTNGMPTTDGGKVLHVDVAPGQVANRVVTVGSASRAHILASHLDGVNGGDPRACSDVFFHESSRGYTTYTGTLGGVGITVLAIGMGMPMMDFAVREVRAVVEGPMIMVRYGTCGGLRADVPAGSVAVASEGAVSITRNPDAFGDKPGPEVQKYNISDVVACDAQVAAAMATELEKEIQELGVGVCHGLNVTADSFYSSQGRKDPNFEDGADGLMEEVHRRYPAATSMEMETFRLFDLARVCNVSIKTAAAAIIVANRPTGDVMDGTLLKNVESRGGLAIMRAVANSTP